MLMRIMAQQQQEVQPPGSGLALLVAQVSQVSALLEAAALHRRAGPLTPPPAPLPCTATLPITSSGGPASPALGHEEAVLQTALSQVVLALPPTPHSRQQPWGGGMDTMRSSMELPVQLPAMVQVESCLRSASTWAFDAFQLTSATAGRPLSVLAYWLLQHHAADVVQTMHMLLTRGGLMPGYADHLTQLAAYLAAVSPMENHHLAGAFSLLKHPDLNFLQAMPKATYDRLRKLVIELVLGTDMKQHFSIMGSFTAMHRAAPAMLQSKRSAQGLDRASHAVTPSELSMASSCRPTGDGQCAKDAGKKLQPSSEQDKLLSLQMALKCSDLGHLAAPLPVHLVWVSRLEAEFFTQGDAERAHGLPISPLCDRTKQGITKSQVGFFDFVALPLFNNFTTRFTAAKPLLSGVTLLAPGWAQQAVVHLPCWGLPVHRPGGPALAQPALTGLLAIHC
ncbi:3'5'-cyclic nucleotide phosphodiesterase [Haematococcus lacustris]|uniref:3'5'-cyclic nucleotide phosphodiesterase n=1 Tax=Haematococcus lacustris TaxID=44745 RepID=A0A699ZKP6_HAELA|nr:3'5'-cyclic nucleotide phosphodiesterase [Haematococcus lacustris]